MNPNFQQRLAELDKTLDTYHRKLSSFRYRRSHSSNAAEEFDLDERIQQTKQDIRGLEIEYWQFLDQAVPSNAVDEVHARNAIVQVVQEVELIENKPSANYPDEFMQLLLEIRDKLNEPEKLAAAKLKLAMPIVPQILSYEVELDTENTLRRAFQPIKGLFKKALEKK